VLIQLQKRAKSSGCKAVIGSRQTVIIEQHPGPKKILPARALKKLDLPISLQYTSF
jgi:hypothetical protein